MPQCRRHLRADGVHQTFREGWSSLFFIAPGLHPDESGHEEGGWPVGWRCLGAEAFRRAETGELSDEELYPSQAAHVALVFSRNFAERMTCERGMKK